MKKDNYTFSKRNAGANAAAPAEAPKKTVEPEKETELPLLANNFVIMIASALLIIIGFALIGGSPSTMESYNPSIFSTTRIVVGPLLAFIGFVAMAVAIIVKPKDKIPFKKGKKA